MIVKTKIIVADFYKDELFKFMPEEMFNLLDEAYFWKETAVKLPDNLIEEFTKNKIKSTEK